ncbi:MAG: A/G-specific adenine glycosylase [Actinomycetales bacterium]
MSQVPTPQATPTLVQATLAWFTKAARDLPWRRDSCTPWGVLVSEVMLQQTQVDRVLPVWLAWLERWPTHGDLAAANLGSVLRAWGRLGYPRRAQRLHAAAKVLVDQYHGRVPDDDAALRALPGVGEYTAAAVRAFAFGQPSVVLDTNVRRVIARACSGMALPAAHLTNIERTLAATLVQTAGDEGARWSAAVMELGALVCTTRGPLCGDCPIQAQCSWYQAGRPANVVPRRQQPRFTGSDRQVRGLILAQLREGSVPVAAMDLIWPIDDQRQRALVALQAEGLVITRRGRYRLPDS